MKTRLFLFCLITLVLRFEVVAQESLLSDTTGRLFTNELDAALNAYEDSSGPGFTDLERNYLFGGFENPYKITATGTDNTFYAGYYRAGERPWSLYTRIMHSDVGSETIEDGTHEDGNKRLFSEVDDYVQFLMSFGDFTTGAQVSFYMDDNKTAADNYTHPATGIEYTDKNNTNFYIDLTVPFFYHQGDRSHYVEAGVLYSRTDNSSSESGGATDFDTESIFSLIEPHVEYTYTMPMLNELNQGNEIAATAMVAVGFNSSRYVDDDEATATKTEIDRVWGKDFTIGLSLVQDIYFSTPDWLSFGISPGVVFTYDREQKAAKEATTIINGIEGPTIKRDKYYDSATSIGFSCAFGAEMKPENWIIGTMLGVESTLGVSFENSFTDNGTTETRERAVDWKNTVIHSYGIFLPLPDDYRIDITTNLNAFEFSSLQIELIVPIAWK